MISNMQNNLCTVLFRVNNLETNCNTLNNKFSRLEKKILLRYFKTLNNKSAKELLDDTNCIIEIVPKKYTVWKY